jgi:hypothetical protein
MLSGSSQVLATARYDREAQVQVKRQTAKQCIEPGLPVQSRKST